MAGKVGPCGRMVKVVDSQTVLIWPRGHSFNPEGRKSQLRLPIWSVKLVHFTTTYIIRAVQNCDIPVGSYTNILALFPMTCFTPSAIYFGNNKETVKLLQLKLICVPCDIKSPLSRGYNMGSTPSTSWIISVLPNRTASSSWVAKFPSCKVTSVALTFNSYYL